ncbi:hypothetical protein DFR50_14349 [Roseiarcus fermentans]|uniref:Uncharacterized protein n=1 Tax=Roseiarcus fermentans TaxID=1473586 RepID=A0A366EME5_9HYPH|nr:hypothetical protein DFR50_14349 [Roseiarcus fermentans]
MPAAQRKMSVSRGLVEPARAVGMVFRQTKPIKLACKWTGPGRERAAGTIVHATAAAGGAFQEAAAERALRSFASGAKASAA